MSLFYLVFNSLEGKIKERIALAALIASIYGASDEIHQYFAPNEY